MYDLSVVAILADPHFFVLVTEVTHQPKIASAFRAFFLIIHKTTLSRLIAVGIPPTNHRGIGQSLFWRRSM
jgi:hypothetical protein